MKKQLLIILVLSFLSLNLNAQSKKCATMKHLENRIMKDPSVLTRIEQTEAHAQKWISSSLKSKSKNDSKKLEQVITIPVVVHVLWNNPIENISDAQIHSQIDVLNEDYRLLNSDSLKPSHPFWIYTADTEIEFCLASRDPNGKVTNGITRTYTDSSTFVGDGNEKFTATGGKDNWDPTKYLNLWVCNLDGSDGTLGYAAFPSDLLTYPDEDGVVIRYQAFGYIGTATAPYDQGRTATHEIGHWLNLRHIWGDEICGDDFVYDTKPSKAENTNCPTFPHNANSSCGSGVNGEMYMNYMDYVDDGCMNMFTYGQALRMDATLNVSRVGLLTSSGCRSLTNVTEIAIDNSIEIYPNPSKGNFTINLVNSKSDNLGISVYDIMGSKIHEFKNIKSVPFNANLNELSNGIYYIKIEGLDTTITEKIIISK